MTRGNPFHMTFGQVPENYVDRPREKDLIKSSFSLDGTNQNAFVISGARGSGKTVLLAEMYRFYSEDKEWIVADPGIKNDLLENLASSIYENGKDKGIFKKSEFDYSYSGKSMRLIGKAEIKSIEELFFKMCKHIEKKNKKVLISIDEAIY